MPRSQPARQALQVIAAAGALVVSVVACGTDDTGPAEHTIEGTMPGAAFGIAAEPGPNEGSITVSWSPVTSALGYAVYFRTAPAVTPSNGQRIATPPTSFAHSQLTAGATYYYIVAGLNGDFEGPQSNEVFATPKSGLGFHVETPVAGDVVSASLPFVIDVSTTSLASLTASTGGIIAPLTFDASIGRWTGTLSLATFESPSARTLLVRAQDTQGRVATGNVLVRYDRPPVVTVVSPADQASASPSVRITAACADDFRTGCVALLAYVGGSRATPLASGTDAIDAVVSLANFGEGVVHLVIEGVDSANQSTIVRRDVVRQ